MSSGIYKIANKITGDFYVGSAINLKNRFYRHKSNLKLNGHQNRYLQNSYNKYGKENFEFKVIEHIENKNKLIEREQFYIDDLNPKYNICKIANSSLGIKRTEETKKKLSLAKRGNKNALGARRSMKTRLKISKNSAKYWKNKKRSEEAKQKMSKAHAKPFKIVSPEGKTFTGINLLQFCKENNLSQGNMCRVLHGKSKSHKGWTKPQ